MRDFKKINIKDYETSQLQNNTAEFISQLTSNPTLSGLLIEDVSLTFGSTTTVNHGLGRTIRGFVIVYKNNSVEVWADDANQTLPAKQLILSTSADATISLWVF